MKRNHFSAASIVLLLIGHSLSIQAQSTPEITAGMDRHDAMWSIFYNDSHIYGINDVNFILGTQEIFFGGLPISDVQGFYSFPSGDWSIFWTLSNTYSLRTINGILTAALITDTTGALIGNVRGCFRHSASNTIIWTPTNVFNVALIGPGLLAFPVLAGGLTIAGTEGVFLHDASWSILWTPANVLGISGTGNALVTTPLLDSVTPLLNTQGCYKHNAGWSLLYTLTGLYSIRTVGGVPLVAQVLDVSVPIPGVRGCYKHSDMFSIFWTAGRTYSIRDINSVLIPDTILVNGVDIANTRGVYHMLGGWTILWTSTNVYSIYDINFVLTPAEVLHNGASIPGVQGCYKHDAAFTIMWRPTNVYSLIDNNFTITPTEITLQGASIIGTQGVFNQGTGWSVLWTPINVFGIRDINFALIPDEVFFNNASIQNTVALMRHQLGHSILETSTNVLHLQDINFNLVTTDITDGPNSIPSYDTALISSIQVASLQTPWDPWLLVDSTWYTVDSIPVYETTTTTEYGLIISGETCYPTDTIIYSPDTSIFFEYPCGMIMMDSLYGIVISTPDSMIFLQPPDSLYWNGNCGGCNILIIVGQIQFSFTQLVGWIIDTTWFDTTYYEITPYMTCLNGAGIVGQPAEYMLRFIGQPRANVDVFTAVPFIPSSTTVWGVEETALGNPFYNYMILGPTPVAGVLEGDAVKMSAHLLKDFGDAPDPPFATLNATNGACHGMVADTLFLGLLKDNEDEGQANILADGDDNNLPDDEDGVNIGPLQPGIQTIIGITANAGGGLLNAWLDFNADGDWLDAGEHIFTDLPLLTGLNNLPLLIPADALPGPAYARFRYALGTTGITGFVPSGEVEDYRVIICNPLAVNCPNNFTCCENDPPVVLSGATPPGGTYTGPGVLNNTFNPANTGPGVNILTYSYIDPVSSCPGSCTFLIIVNASPVVSCPSSLNVCTYDPAFILGGAIPAGGVYTENGNVITVFDPANAAPGVHPIIYTYTDGNGCSASCTFNINLFQPPDVSCPQNISLCTNDPPFILSGASPAGGTYYFNGQPVTVFDPFASGTGVYNLTYVYTDPLTGCYNSCNLIISVFDPPQLSCPSNISVCLNSPAFILTGATPPGGVYMKNFNVITQFNPSVEGAGNHSIWYVYTDPLTGCEGICSFLITVYPLPQLNCPPDISTTISSPPFTLSGASPAGGTYNGPGITANLFSPAIAGNGVHIITYIYIDPSTGCGNSCTFVITVTGNYDMGDAPDPNFPTLLSNDGARHFIVTGMRLGNLVDTEPDGLPNNLAQGDDNNSEDDEDGVVRNWGEITGSPVNITVTASAPGYLDAWMDFNNNGSWSEADEKIFNNRPLVTGANVLSFIVPSYATGAGNYARFRYSIEGGLDYTGAAASGEVEDYLFLFTIDPDNKWHQPPNALLDGIPVHTATNSDTLAADDWLCFGGEVTSIAWYGSYIGTAGNELRGAGILSFLVEIYGSDNQSCLPQTNALHTAVIPFADLNETATGIFNNGLSQIYEYSYVLPFPFQQTAGNRYWLKISANAVSNSDPPYWRWQEAARSHVPVLCAGLWKTINNGVPGDWVPLSWTQEGKYSDLAFTISGNLVPSIIGGMIRYDNPVVNPPMSNTTVFKKQGGSIQDATVTDLNGNYQFTNVDPGYYRLDGETSKAWGGVNATDALLCLRIFVGLSPCPPPDGDTLVCLACDVNWNGVINSIDALMISRRYVGMINSFPAGDWLFEKPPLTVTQGSTSTVNFKAICMGDANRNYNPPNTRTRPEINLIIKGITAFDKQGLAEIPIRTEHLLTAGAISLSLTIPSEWQILDVRNPYPTIGGFHWTGSGGQLKISWFSLIPMILQPEQSLFTIKIKTALKPMEQVPPVLLESSAISDEAALELSGVTLSMPEIFPAANTGNYLCQNQPNPFTGKTEVRFYLNGTSTVKITVMNSLGQTVSEHCAEEQLPAGWHKIMIDGSVLTGGVYTYQLAAYSAEGNTTLCRKLVVLK
ncbi:MAG TPA: GEVED domain-containing protein [Bacteroidales bacterium]|nr:GEVED domain-containing protein [Bacteroidales bacterium]HSA44320.1 GEVED domain-containing protein [Bacteroidales bacterium]